MSTTKTRTIEKEFDQKYKNPHMRLHLEEIGWRYIGERNQKTVFRMVY